MFLDTLDPEVGRFINADVLMSTGQGVLGCNMFCYCLNNPIDMMDESGRCAVRSYSVMMTDGGGGNAYKRSALVIYYDHDQAKEKLLDQAKNSCYRKFYDNWELKSVGNSEELISAWNSIKPSTDDVFIFIHSNADEFIFSKDDRFCDFAQLDQVFITGNVYLFACHAAGFADKFALQTGTSVIATHSSVNYCIMDGAYYPRPDFATQFFHGSKWIYFKNVNGLITKNIFASPYRG